MSDGAGAQVIQAGDGRTLSRWVPASSATFRCEHQQLPSPPVFVSEPSSCRCWKPTTASWRTRLNCTSVTLTYVNHFSFTLVPEQPLNNLQGTPGGLHMCSRLEDASCLLLIHVERNSSLRCENSDTLWKIRWSSAVIHVIYIPLEPGIPFRPTLTKRRVLPNHGITMEHHGMNRGLKRLFPTYIVTGAALKQWIYFDIGIWSIWSIYM